MGFEPNRAAGQTFYGELFSCSAYFNTTVFEDKPTKFKKFILLGHRNS